MSSLKSLDMHFLCMEHLGFFGPFVDDGGDGRHGKDHCGDSLINPQGKLVNEDDVISDSSFAGKVLEVSDVLLKSIVCDPIEVADDLLDDFGQIKAGSGFGVEGIKGGFKVFSEFVEGFVRGFDGGVGHLIIPHFSKGGTLSFTHLVKGHHNLVIVSGVECGIDGEVGFHGLDPS